MLLAPAPRDRPLRDLVRGLRHRRGAVLARDGAARRGAGGLPRPDPRDRRIGPRARGRGARRRTARGRSGGSTPPCAPATSRASRPRCECGRRCAPRWSCGATTSYSDPAPPGPFDLVVCRNVLIYFDARPPRAIAARLLDAVAPGRDPAPRAGGGADRGAARRGADRGGRRRRCCGGSGRASGPRRGRRGREARPRAAPRRRDRPAARPRGRHGERAASAASVETTSTPAPTDAGAVTCALDSAAVGRYAQDRLREAAPAAERSRRTSFEDARDAARRGEIAFAERIAREVAERDLCPRRTCSLSMAADARGDVAGAVDALRRALYPRARARDGPRRARAALRAARAARAGRARAAERALEAVEGLDDGATLRGVETITAGALRSALGDRRPARPRTPEGAET